MAVSQHPSMRPSPPRSPPRTTTTSGTADVIHTSGQPGVPYGFKHELKVSATPHKSEMAHHFHDMAKKAGRKESQEGPKAGDHVKRPGDETTTDEPG